MRKVSAVIFGIMLLLPATCLGQQRDTIDWTNIEVAGPRAKLAPTPMESVDKKFPVWTLFTPIAPALILIDPFDWFDGEDEPPATPVIARNDTYNVPCNGQQEIAPLDNDEGEGIFLVSFNTPGGYTISQVGMDRLLVSAGSEAAYFSYTIEGVNGEQATAVITINIQDLDPPIVQCPADATIDCTASTDPMNTGSVTASDACDSQPLTGFVDEIVTGLCPQNRTIIRTWTATDANGGTAKCVQEIQLSDTKAPVIQCPPDISIVCENNSDLDITGSPILNDDCDPNPTFTYTDQASMGELLRTFTATDACGNQSTCRQGIRIDDDEPPMLNCPEDVTISCEQTPDPGVTGIASATDNCDDDPQTTYFDDQVAGHCPQAYSLVRTWTTVDNTGLTTTCQQQIEVIDNEPPTIKCPEDITVECEESTEPATTGEATATDNCDTNPSIGFTDQASINEILRTFSATDACSNQSTCLQSIGINDLEPPTIFCPDGVTIDCDASSDPGITGSATAIDNCDGSPNLSYTNDHLIGDCPQNFTIQRQWVARDNAMLSASCIQSIEIIDTNPPLLSCPDNVTINCDQPPEISLTGEATATDNCDTNPSIDYTDQTSMNEILRSFSATDACGNQSTCVQSIRITDPEPPSITCPDAITIECDSPTDPDITGTASAIDNCDDSLEIFYSDDQLAGNCPQNVSIQRHWVARDNAMLQASCIQLIEIIDSESPLITCPDNVTIACDDSTDPDSTGIASASDNCGLVVIEFTDEITSTGFTRTFLATDECQNSSNCDQLVEVRDTQPPTISCPDNLTIECEEITSPDVTGYPIVQDNCSTQPTMEFTDDLIAGTCIQEYTILRTWTAQDDSDNTSTCEQMIDVQDNGSPDISCPEHITLFCTDPIDPMMTGLPTVIDLCDPFPEVQIEVDITIPGDCPASYQIVRIWSTTDDCGNTSTCQQVIEIVDNEGPELACPVDITIECDDPLDPGLTGIPLIIGDNCSSVSSPQYTEDLIPGPCIDSPLLERTWSVSDVCGNSSTCLQHIQILDTEAPVLISPAPDITILCSPPPEIPPVFIDGCDDQIDLSYDLTIATIPPDITVYTYMWTGVDNCGNSSVQIQTITNICSVNKPATDQWEIYLFDGPSGWFAPYNPELAHFNPYEAPPILHEDIWRMTTDIWPGIGVRFNTKYGQSAFLELNRYSLPFYTPDTISATSGSGNESWNTNSSLRIGGSYRFSDSPVSPFIAAGWDLSWRRVSFRTTLTESTDYLSAFATIGLQLIHKSNIQLDSRIHWVQFNRKWIPQSHLRFRFTL